MERVRKLNYPLTGARLWGRLHKAALSSLIVNARGQPLSERYGLNNINNI